MLKTHTLRKACLIASLALGTMLTVSAQEWLNYGKHIHGHPVSDETAHAFMKKYFGYKQDATVDTLYNFSKDVAPTDVAKDEMLLVEVNPYWRGVNRYPTMDSEDVHSVTTLVNGEPIVPPNWIYAKYAIKAVHKVGAPNNTNNGKLYAYSGKLGRFYFAKRRETGYDNAAGKPQANTLSRWYDEWSLLPPNTTAPSTYGWKNFGGVDHYMDFIKGAVYYAPHNCPNSLDINHYVSFIKEGAEDSFDGYDASILFYISNVWDDVNTKGESVDKNMPFMCMLRAIQEPTKVAKVAEVGETKYYDVTVTFNSTFTEAEKTLKETDEETMWTAGKEGVREFFDIYRTDKDGNRVLVAENVPADQLSKDPETGKYTYVDTNNDAHFPGEGGLGTDYVYDITSKIYNVDATGAIVGTTIATAQSENRPAHIPGAEAFSLSVDGETKCTYQPSKTFGLGMNNFTHIINAEVVNDFVYAAGDIVELRQYMEGSETPTWKKTGEALTGTGNISDVIEASWKQITYEFPLKGGDSKDAKYQLVLMRKNAETNEYEDLATSNMLTLSAYRADLTAEDTKHRQGHPSDKFSPTTEVYHNEVTFTPSKDAKIIYYAVVCNGDPYEVNVITRDVYGTAGEPYTAVVLHNDKFANKDEQSATGEGMELFYTNVAFDDKGNSYGSADVKFSFTGSPDELVFKAGDTKEEVSHNYYAWIGKFDFNLLDGSNEADDVDTDMVQGVKIYGKFYEKVGNEEVFVEEKEVTAFPSWNDAKKLSFEKEVNLKYDPEYKTEWGLLKDAYEADGATMENELWKTGENSVNTWKVICEDLWYKFIPRYIYVEITYYNPDPTPGPTPAPSVKAAPVARSQSVPVSNSTYKKFTNWAQVTLPDFDKPGITGIETIDTDAKVAVYPNPATDEISFCAQGTVDIYNLAGSRVMTLTANGKTTVDVSVLPAGTYILRTGKEAHRFIIAK